MYMCGRFMLDSDIEDILRQYRIIKSQIGEYEKGDFYPSQKAPIIVKDEGNLLKSAKWGFPLYDSKKLVINARAESISEKQMFKNSFLSARCIIPASLFYEWKEENREKVKHEIYLKDKKIISLGGIFKLITDDKGSRELSFVIITTEANKYMKDIHSRMPLIIDDDALDYWLDKSTSMNTINEIIKFNASHELNIEKADKDKPFEQLKLF